MSTDPQLRDALRTLPQVQRLLENARAGELCDAYSRSALLHALRHVLDEARASLREEPTGRHTSEALLDRAEAVLRARSRPALRGLINATGVVLHTNLGRAPLPKSAVEAMASAGAGYATLEFDLVSGTRGTRGAGMEALLREVTGAEAALAVNNAAAAVFLALSGLAAGGEVIVSRGELVEIGGGFRIPEVIAQGGCRLVEVGTTNKTRIEDYRRAITDRTRVLLKVHQSNYRIVGFTADASLEALSALARDHGLLVMHDLGSGALIDMAGIGRAPEPRPQDSLMAGADLVAFSGDKLMGGPQAGLLVGRERAIAPLRRHPLMRALRLDKVTLAALEATLRLYLAPERAIAEIPTLRMLAQSAEEVSRRAFRLKAALSPGLACQVAPSEAQVGGGSLPGQGLESACVLISPANGDLAGFAGRLRSGEPPVVARISAGRLVLDLFTVPDEDVETLARQVNLAGNP